MAGLGVRPGRGESLTSWLIAGPVGAGLWVSNRRNIGVPVLRDAAYCPKCYLVEQGRKRWYTKTQWADPRQVICVEHGLPLIRCARQLVRLRAPVPSQVFRSKVNCLGDWIGAWRRRSPCTPGGWLLCRGDCLEDQILWALTGQMWASEASTQAFWLSHWRLRIDGWPLPTAPHSSPAFQIGLITHQTDRLALVGTVQWAWSHLNSEKESNWPPLRIERTSFEHLQAALRNSWPHLTGRLPLVLISD